VSVAPVTSTLVAFPDRRVVTPREASAHIGIAPGSLNRLRLLRCGPNRIVTGHDTLYRIEDLDAFKAALLVEVGLDPTTCRPAAKEDDTPVVLPFMQLLIRRRIVRRIILLSLWSALGLGTLSTLILF
jgi:hypothetical protein